MTSSKNGKNGITPAYEDKVMVKNKINKIKKTDMERTILMHPHVGKEGRKKDMRMVNFVQAYRSETGRGIDLFRMMNDDEAYIIIAEAADMEEDFEWLDESLTFSGWVALAERVLEYRQLGEEIFDFEDALKKSEADRSEEDEAEAVALP